MSMASPTLRSSSTMVPRPSLSSWLTSMPLLPSTALTVTGTSNTASRSAAVCLGAASIGMSVLSNAPEAPGAPSWLRSGRSTLSVAMGLSFHYVREMTGNKGAERVLDDAFAAFGAAAAPFDAAIGAGHGGIGGDQHAALITFLLGDVGQPGFQHLGHRGRGTQGDARFGDRLVHGLAQRGFHIAGGQGSERGRRDLLGHRHRQARGIVAHPIDFGMAKVECGAHRNGQSRDGAFQG